MNGVTGLRICAGAFGILPVRRNRSLSLSLSYISYVPFIFIMPVMNIFPTWQVNIKLSPFVSNRVIYTSLYQDDSGKKNNYIYMNPGPSLYLLTLIYDKSHKTKSLYFIYLCIIYIRLILLA